MGENNSFTGYGIEDEMNTPIISPNDTSGEISNILNEPNEWGFEWDHAVTSALREIDELMDQPIPSTSLGEYYDTIGDLLAALEQVPASNPNETTTDVLPPAVSGNVSVIQYAGPSNNIPVDVSPSTSSAVGQYGGGGGRNTVQNGSTSTERVNAADNVIYSEKLFSVITKSERYFEKMHTPTLLIENQFT